MDFFSQQDKARRNTSLLVVLFLCAVLALIVITNVLIAASLMVLTSGQGDMASTLYSGQFSQHFSWQRFAYISLAVCAVLVCAMAYKWIQLSAGGKAVAEALGGRRVYPNTDDRNEIRVLNVVEEMAIASGMPVPAVYLLADEIAINAFAAGSTPADAVIGVTLGAIEQLNREQLQGVIAHEFSHVLNGDMRLNMRLIALLHGILFIGNTGELLMRSGGFGRRSYTSSSRIARGRSTNAQVAILGLALVVVGWLGGFFGSLIKAAVSRQREFLADASAVQFTRNPHGIADALKIIAAYSPAARINNAGAIQFSHLFFAQALSRIQATFATHPPLAERIQRIDPAWDGQFIKRSSVRRNNDYWRSQAPTKVQDIPGQQRQAVVIAAAQAVTMAALLPAADAASTVAEVREGIDALPALLREQVHESFGAMAVVYSLLLSDEPSVQQVQLAYIKQAGIAGLALQVLQLQPVLTALDEALKLPVVALAMPALKCLSPEQYKIFKRTLLLLIRADKQMDLFEWCVYQLLRHYLDGEFGIASQGQRSYKKLQQVQRECQQVLSVLARSGSDSTAGFKRGMQVLGLPELPLLGEQDCGLDEFSRAVNSLANCLPLLKPVILKALVECVRHDGVVAPAEREVLLAIAAVMDCPLPRFNMDRL